MTEAILLLRLEHNQMDELLKFIEQELDQDRPVDMELLQSIVEYFADYPDQCHHPVEDLVYRKLYKRNSSRTDTVSEILKGHRDISKMTKQFVTALRESVGDESIRTTTLRETMRQFVDQYRAHMRAEESDFFPLALDVLHKSDWAEVEYELFDRRDPLYDREVEERFVTLRKKIEELASTSCRRAASFRRARILRQLKSMHAFNDMMEEVGHDYRLVEHPEGTYGLEHRGQGIIDIPKCCPIRASWCAYFYVEALSQSQ